MDLISRLFVVVAPRRVRVVESREEEGEKLTENSIFPPATRILLHWDTFDTKYAIYRVSSSLVGS